MSKVKINLFGEMWKLTKLNVDCALYLDLKERALEIGESWPNGLLAVNFFDTTSFNNYTSFEDLGSVCNSGLRNTYKNQIEIWYGGKKIRKLKMSDLNNLFLLFPLYQTIKTVLNYADLEKGIYVEQYEIGLVGSYEREVEDFQIDKLIFSNIMLERKGEIFEVLNEISYEGKCLKGNDKKIDTLITKQICFEV